MATSTAYIILQNLGYRYSFDGVTSISHALSLKVATDSDSDEDGDYVNHAKNEPDVLTLSVVASDANAAVIGWSRQTLASLCQIKEKRFLCKVVTSLRTYDDMLLTALAVQQDDTCPDGWTGTLTFTKSNQTAAYSPSWPSDSSSYSGSSSYGSSASYTSSSSYTAKPVSSGSSAAKSAGSQDGSVLQTILREAGING